MSSDLSKLSAFVTGRVIHQGTGEPVLGAVRITSPEGRVWSRVLDDGTFVVAADLEMLMPDLATQQYDINLMIRADSQQFRPGFIERTEPVSVPAGSDFDPDPPATPPDPLISLGTIAFAADPINIRGRVIQAENPDQGIPGATVDDSAFRGSDPGPEQRRRGRQLQVRRRGHNRTIPDSMFGYRVPDRHQDSYFSTIQGLLTKRTSACRRLETRKRQSSRSQSL